MFHLIAALLASVTMGIASVASAAELIMVEEVGCIWCEEWNSEIAPIYPKTAEGRYAPLRRIDIREPVPSGLSFRTRPVFTPTFILVEGGEEVGRIEGYPGEDFFWGLLERMLLDTTNYERPAS